MSIIPNGATSAPTANGQAPGANGRAHEGKSRVTQCLLEKGRPDAVDIGCPRYQPGEEDDSGTWADLEKFISGVKWLVRGWVPFGMLTGLVAEPKAGKSAFALWGLMRPVLTGCGWFNGLPGTGEPGYVVYCDTERSAAVNISRMKAWALPTGHILTPFKDPHKVIDIDDEAHTDRILDVVCRYKARLVVVDSYRGAHKGDENNSRIAGGLQALGGVCEETGAGCAVIHHAKKMTVGEDMTLNAGRGSNAFLAAVRVQLAIDIPDPAPDLRRAWRRLKVLGENLGIAPQPVGFRFTDKGLEFGPAPTRPSKDDEEGGRAPSGKDRAVKWLEVRMPPGEWCPAGPLEAEAEALGFDPRGTLARARGALGITQSRTNVRKTATGWEWRLPGASVPRLAADVQTNSPR